MNDFLSSLNDRQKEAVLDFENPLLVLAGAGSGKTRVITTKIAYAIEELGYRPYEILAVTFTNRAALEMRERVQALLPHSNLDGLEIRTFHSYGAYLLRRYGSLIGLFDNFSIYDEDDSLNLLSSCFPDVGKKELRPYVRKISLLKDQGTYDQKYLKRVEDSLPSFRYYFEKYEERLRSSGCVDFADLIIRTEELLATNGEVKARLNNRYRLILVDEYQDSNSSQFQLLYTLIGKKTQICVVGDDDQSIYRFRGAEISNILSFPDRFKDTHIVKLEQNYRSTSSILKIATHVIKNNKSRHDKTLWTDNEDGKKPVVFRAYNSRNEAEWIANEILKNGNYADTAILYRLNMLSLELETALTKKRIPYKLIGALSFFEREEIKDVIMWFKLILNPYDLVAFLRVINKPSRGLGKKTVEKLTYESSDYIENARALASIGGERGKAIEGLKKFLSCYDKIKDMILSNMPLSEVLVNLLELSELNVYYEAEKDETVKKSRLDNLSELGNALNEVSPGFEGLATYIEKITLDSSTIRDGEEAKPGVSLISMHNTKGLEFDRVFIVGLEEGIIPGDKSTGEDDIEEERRLFYVAITRARKTLYFSWAGNRKRWGQFSERRTATRFLSEIPSSFLSVVSDSYGGYEAFAFKPRNVFRSSIGTPVMVNRKVIPNYRIGDVVRSSEYGIGSVIDVSTKLGRTNIRVQFEGKVLVCDAQFAQLEVLQHSGDVSYKVGDRVRSPEYGIGVVIGRELSNGREIIDVQFEEKKARFNPAYSKLEKL